MFVLCGGHEKNFVMKMLLKHKTNYYMSYYSHAVLCKLLETLHEQKLSISFAVLTTMTRLYHVLVLHIIVHTVSTSRRQNLEHVATSSQEE